VTVASGVCLSVAIDTLDAADLRVEAGATLDVTLLQTLAVGDHRIASCLTVAEGAHITFNGGDLPSYCTRAGNVVTVQAHSPVRRNPVTDAEASFAYLFAGETDGEWSKVDNWSRYDSALRRWVPLTGAQRPFLPQGLWDPAVVDGAWIGSEGSRNVRLTGSMEGWTLRLALFNCATVTVDNVNKFQCSGGGQWLWVDATSKLTFLNFDGTGNSDGVMSFSVASSNGITFVKTPSADTTYHYYLKDDGSVCYQASVNLAKHAIRHVEFTLSEAGLGRAVRSKRLVAFAGASGVCATNGATVVVRDPLSSAQGAVLKSAPVTADDPLGTCTIETCADGVWLSYVDRAGGDVYVHEVAGDVSVDRVEIPFAWLMRLASGPNALLSPENLTEAAVAAALESTQAANGLKPWQSYLLGLDPTNATDDVSCALEIGEGGRLTVRLRNVDPARQPNAAAVRYVLQHKESLADEWTDHSTNTQTTVIVEPDGAPARFFRYLILLKAGASQ